MQLIYHLGVLGWTFFLISYCVYSLMLMSMESWLLWMTVGTGCPSWNSIYLIGEAFSSYFAFELDFKQYTCICVCVCVCVCVCILLLFHHQVMPDSSWPHGLQHAGLPCPSSLPGICPSSCPLNLWCHSNTSSLIYMLLKWKIHWLKCVLIHCYN